MATPVEDMSQQAAPPPAPKGRLPQTLGAIAAGLVVIALATLLLNRISTANTQAHNVPPAAKGISLVGKAAPDVTFSAWTLTPGKNVSLASLRGRPVVLNFWESSCDPCVAEAPLFAQAARTYQSKGVVFVGVALYTSQADGMTFLRQHGVTYLTGAATTNQTVVDYSLIGVPDTYFINSAGVVVDQNVGQISQQKLTEGILKALG